MSDNVGVETGVVVPLQRGQEHLKKEAAATPERQAIISLLRGFGEIRRWSEKRALPVKDTVDELTYRMEELSKLLVTKRRGEGITAEIDTDLDMVSGALNMMTLPDQEIEQGIDEEGTQSMLSHVEVFPLAVHDIRNGLVPIVASGPYPGSEDLIPIWNDVNSMTGDTIAFFRDPTSTIHPVSLADIDTIINKTVYSQSRRHQDLAIKFEGFPSQIVGEDTINFSPFLLRSIVANAAQNTLRAAKGKQPNPELDVRLSTEQDNSGAGTMVIELIDNAGGFPQEFIDKQGEDIDRESRHYEDDESNAASQGIAMKSLRGLILGSGGQIRYDNVDRLTTDSDTTAPRKGAKIKISFPVAANAA